MADLLRGGWICHQLASYPSRLLVTDVHTQSATRGATVAITLRFFHRDFLILRLSIGLRLFASVLLAIVAVAAAGIGLMRHNVMQSFSEYAVNIELDRLDELSRDLGRRYAANGSWSFVPGTQAGRRQFIAAELRRLQSARSDGTVVLPAPPAPPAAPAAPAPPAVPVAAVTPNAPIAPLPAPPVPPVPPAPPAPPSPDAPDDIDQLGLQDRVTLLDADGRYLAGRQPGSEPAAQRAIDAGGKNAGYLRVARVMRPSDALAAAFLDQLKSSLWAIVAASVALSAMAAVLLAAHFRKPIRRLAAGAQALAQGRFDTRLDVRRSDELGELAQSFNRLAEQLDAMEASRRQWVADTSHELRTPLAVLRAQLEAIEDGVRSADPGTLAAMLRQVMALNKLIDQLYALARADVGALDCQRQPVDVWALACECAAESGTRLHAAGLALDLGTAPRASMVAGDADRLRQVFGNLFENALRYTAGGGRVALGATEHDGVVEVTVDDSAPGVPDDALPRLAERFYRVDASRSRANGGAGLGLSLCQRIVESHGGTLGFSHSPLGGLRVTITLPMEAA
jgi:two-component system sensor histidine kinase BaeS